MRCPFVIKICTRCKRILVANKMNFCKAKKGRWGLESVCKECNKIYREKHEEKIKKYRKKYYEDNKKEILEKCKEYREEHKEKIKKYQKEYSEKHKEEKREMDRRYRENNDEKIKTKRKEYYENNKEKIKEKVKKYNKENPHIKINSHVKRREKEENQGKGFTKEQWLEMMEFFDWKCAYSGEKLDKNTRTIDHIVPLDKGGKHEIWNLVPMCKSYNSSKHTKDMLNWYIQQEFFLEERLNKIYEWIEYAKNKYQK